MLATAVSFAVLTGFGLGWFADRRVRRDVSFSRAFDREFATLVAETPIDWAGLHGPGPAGSAAGLRAFAAQADRAQNLAPRAKALSPDDLEYYAASWRNIRGQFLRYPVSALRLTRHLTANLLVNRGLMPADATNPARLPEGWVFPSARGYREALEIAANAENAENAGATTSGTDASAAPKDNPTDTELARALALFEDFYWEILALAPVSR